MYFGRHISGGQTRGAHLTRNRLNSQVQIGGYRRRTLKIYVILLVAAADAVSLCLKVMSDNHGAMAKHTTINHWDQGN